MKSDLHFKESNITFLKLFVFLFISITFLFFDKDLSYGNKVRDNLSYLIEPVYNLANYPSQISDSMKTFFKTKNELINENNNLKKKIQIQSGIIQNEHEIKIGEILGVQYLITGKVSRIQVSPVDKISENQTLNKKVDELRAGKDKDMKQTMSTMNIGTIHWMTLQIHLL